MGARGTDPLVSFHFSLEVQGAVTGFFTEISGLGSETEIVEHKVVTPTGQEVIQKIPGRLKWGEITLKRGVTAEMDMWKWRKLVEDGKISDARKNGSIVMYDEALKEIARWNFTNGWPSKVNGPQLQADSNAYGVEELTIVHEGIVRAT
jgi:phage tail-like protein